MKKTLIILTMLVGFLFGFWFSQEPGFEIIPGKSDTNLGQTVTNINEWWKVWENYKNVAYWTITSESTRARGWGKLTLGDQFASGIMTWDTILDYAVYLIKFIWQLALLIGALMIIYYGYKKATEHLKFGWTLWKIVVGILVISFAYVIVKVIWNMFIS